MCRTFCKHQALKQRITCQTVRPMDAIAAGLSNRIQMLHRSSAVAEEKLDAKLYICDEAQLCGALGAALFAYEKCSV